MTFAAVRTLTEHGRAEVAGLAHEQLERGWHSAAQLAVYRDGALQLELRLGDGVGADSRMLWFSATKPPIGVAVLMLAERGLLDLDRPIAALWPQFAQGGKDAVTARHVLTHRGGFPVFPPQFDWQRIDDWDAVCDATAALPAQWEPGAAVGYHPVTYGFALGELVRRVDGRMPRDFLREEIFQPLGMDASLGLPEPRHSEIVALEAKSEATWQGPGRHRASHQRRRATLRPAGHAARPAPGRQRDRDRGGARALLRHAGARRRAGGSPHPASGDRT